MSAALTTADRAAGITRTTGRRLASIVRALATLIVATVVVLILSTAGADDIGRACQDVTMAADIVTCQEIARR